MASSNTPFSNTPLNRSATVKPESWRLSSFWLDGWYQGRWWTCLLLPVSWLFRLVVYWRRCYLQSCWRNSGDSRPQVPILVVGNITLGGTGKTPLLIALVKKLRQQGWRPGVISRGFGGKTTKYPLFVSPATFAEEAGDEPVLIAMETGCPVVVSPDRLSAARQLLAQTNCNLILSDDGLQHYRLPRDLEIVVVDAQRGLGNRQCLPAGPLREPVSRLQSVNWVVLNGAMQSDSRLSVNTVAMSLRPHYWNPIVPFDESRGQQRRELSHFPAGSKVHAVAGIGNPERFFQTLASLGLEVIKHPFPDHHSYCPEDLDFGDALAVVMTGKDAVKCRDFAKSNWWYLSVEAQLSETFYRQITQKLVHLQ